MNTPADHSSPSFPHPWIVATALAMTVPFLGKAVHIDDPVYLYIARQILQDPARPFDFQLNWLGQTVPILFTHNHPPLSSYYLAFWMGLFGENLALLHLASGAFSLLAGYSLFWLARRFTQRPLACALWIMLSPAFFVSASTFMLDLPVLALALSATVCFIKGFDENRTSWLAGSGILLALACLTKYSAVLQFPLFLLYAWQRGRWQDAVRPVGIALSLIFIWWGWMYLAYGVLHPLLALEMENLLATSVAGKMGALLSYIGLNFLAFGCFRFRDSWWKWVSPVLAGIVIAVLLEGIQGKYDPILLVLLAANGIVTLLRAASWIAASETRKDPDTSFLAAWFLLALAFVWLAIGFNAMRHILIFLPPMVLLFNRAGIETRNLRAVVPVNIAVTAVLALTIAYADYKFANAFRDGAEGIYKEIASHPAESTATGPRVWFSGHWGFQYYMEAQGARILDMGNYQGLQPGDWVVDNRVAHKNFIPPEARARFQAVKTLDMESSWPIRLMNRSLGAGWYGEMWGPLPFAFGSAEPLESFTLYRVADGPGPAGAP